ncbi:MAG: sigma 54-interacting transcriptional regulator [Nitrospinae bacterium]|nr:sigma 54-interacting transcriptional regulator [Nitrospinota bacterium]
MIKPLAAAGADTQEFQTDGVGHDSRFLAAAFDTIDVGVLIHDEARKVLLFNRAMTRITGLSGAEAIGRDCRSFLTPALCEETCDMCHAAASERHCGPANYEAQTISRDGAAYWVRINSFPFQYGGRPYFLVTLTDVTEMKQMEEQAGPSSSFCGIIGQSKAIKTVFEFIRSAAETDITVLICGETGTGKELIAAAMRQQSLRRKGPFVRINCAALPEHLVESELFGHVKGAYTGAAADRIGRFEAASGGTILLDEIGEVSMQLQAKLLRVLQEKEIERIGENRPRKVDVRILAATNRDLVREVREKRFREDLYFRLAGTVIRLPSLRERKEDIPLLASHFLRHFCAKNGRNIKAISAELMKAMMDYRWPGNIRELHNVMEAGVVMCRKKMLGMESVPRGYFDSVATIFDPPHPDGGEEERAAPIGGLTERERILSALEINRHKVSLTARSLGMSRTTFWRKLKALGIR